MCVCNPIQARAPYLNICDTDSVCFPCKQRGDNDEWAPSSKSNWIYAMLHTNIVIVLVSVQPLYLGIGGGYRNLGIRNLKFEKSGREH